MTKGHLFAPFEWVKNQIKILEQKISDCFQSVSDGKALVASAITDMGVTTASDATFDTMTTNIKAISKGKFIKLGTGTFFDVKTICVDNGIDYTKLTNDNFFVGATYGAPLGKSNSGGTRLDSFYGYVGMRSGFNVTWNYNNGVLTASGDSQSFWGYNTVSGSQAYTQSQALTLTAYLIYNG